MDIAQSFRAWWRSQRARIAEARARAASAQADAIDAGREVLRAPRLSIVARIILAVLLILLIGYPAAAWIYSTIDDDPNFGPPPAVMRAHQSAGVAAAIALIDREVNKNGWAPSAPFFDPPALLDDMPSYQEGIVAALGQFAIALRDRMGRAPGAMEADSDLSSAADSLQYPPNLWYWNPSVSIWPSSSSEGQYRDAIESLSNYNLRLVGGEAGFDSRAEALQVVLGRIANDLGSSSAIIENHLRRGVGLPYHGGAADIFYSNKGRMYAYYIVLKGLQVDYADAIRERHLQATWLNMMASLRAGAGLRPSIVFDGAPDSDLVACTLCGEGFYLLRVRSELNEIANAL